MLGIVVLGGLLGLGLHALVPVLVLSVLVAAGAAAGAVLAAPAVTLRLVHAEPADPERHARLVNLTEGLCATVGVPQPDLFIVDDPARNAMAFGRDQRRAALVITSGLVEGLERIELEGVVARQLVEIKRGDLGVRTLLVTLVGLPAALADLPLRKAHTPPGAPLPGGGGAAAVAWPLVPTAPLWAWLLRGSVTGDHDGMVDLGAVEATRYPPGLAGALERMLEGQTTVRFGGRAVAHLWAADPLPTYEGDGFGPRTLRSLGVHQSLAERAAVLREL